MLPLVAIGVNGEVGRFSASAKGPSNIRQGGLDRLPQAIKGRGLKGVKAIRAGEDIVAARQKAVQVIEKLRALRLTSAPTSLW